MEALADAALGNWWGWIHRRPVVPMKDQELSATVGRARRAIGRGDQNPTNELVRKQRKMGPVSEFAGASRFENVALRADGIPRITAQPILKQVGGEAGAPNRERLIPLTTARHQDFVTRFLVTAP